MKRGKSLLINLSLPLLCALLGTALLMAATLIPRAAVTGKLRDSARELAAKSAYVFDNGRMAYVMDYNTDALIVMESFTLEHGADALKNPMLWLGESRQIEALGEVAEGAEPNTNYVRYWMGFRLPVRALLTLFSYDTICWLLSLCFFALFVLMLARAGERLGAARAACLGIGLILVNPAVAAHSPQYACCFLLSFAALLYLMREKRRVPLTSFYIIIGVLTQYFDFYTAPVLTLGLPLLLCLEAGLFEGSRPRAVLLSTVQWLYGYVGMWLMKLLLTTLFTPENGFQNGLASLLGRLVRASEGGERYRVLDALRRVWEVVFPGALLPLSLALSLLLLALALLGLRRREERDTLCAELLVAALPLLWFAVAVQPTVIHAWFQHRGIAVSFCALLLAARRGLGAFGNGRNGRFS